MFIKRSMRFISNRGSRDSSKVFAIGFPRSATTTMHNLFEDIGFRARHLDRDLCEAISRGDYNFSSIENWDAFSDSPYPLIWKDLYYLYPSARFILHTRPIGKWLKSIERLSVFNQTHGRWADRPENTDMRGYLELLFGTPDFDEKVWSASYERHTKLVTSHFANTNGEKFIHLEMSEEKNKENTRRVLDFLGLSSDGTQAVRMGVANKGGVDTIGPFES